MKLLVFLDSTDPAASQAPNKEGISAVWTVLAKQRWGGAGLTKGTDAGAGLTKGTDAGARLTKGPEAGAGLSSEQTDGRKKQWHFEFFNAFFPRTIQSHRLGSL